MASTTNISIPTFFFFITILLFTSLLVLNPQSVLAQDQEWVRKEAELLLSFKSSVHDPFGHLSTWKNDTSASSICSWNGIVCDAVSSSRVSLINLSTKNLSGELPSSIFQLSYLETIDLSGNQFYGEVPSYVFSSSSLRHLNLSNNNFTGEIPSGISSGVLETLDLSSNILTGEIPWEIGSFSGLRYVDLGGNVLVGRIPISILKISRLESLTLATNQLVGGIPRELGQMTSLRWIYLGYNNLSGEIPEEIGNLTSLEHLDLVYNNLTGGIPPSLGNLTHLRYLFLYGNNLSGSIPGSIFGLQNLISLDLSENSLSGEIPESISQLQSLEVLHLFSNNFTGEIPAGLSALRRLQVLQLWSNRLTGQIPKDLGGKQSNLTVLDLSTNSLTGKIPETLCSSGGLFKLILFSNSLEGEIPVSLSSCRSLKRVRLQNNKLSGELPPEFARLPLVYFMDISGNNFSGRIDHRQWEMPSLQMLNLGRNRFVGGLPESFGSDKLENLDLSENEFSGSIPAKFGALSELMLLKLSGNHISGDIPPEFSSCKKLVTLDLSRNQLSGPIPAELAQLPVLGQLDLSENKLSGEIPNGLGEIESLVQVNISHNNFRGSLPATGAFLALNSTAVAGNNLCDLTTSTGLPPCGGANAKRSLIWHNYLVACILGTLAFIALIAYAVILMNRGRMSMEMKKVENLEDGLTWELRIFDSGKVWRSISMDEILGCRKEENLISKTGDSVSYRGDFSGTLFVVKEIRREMVMMSSIPASFWTEIGGIQHPNVLKLIGVLQSSKGLGFLVYEHVEGRKLIEVVRSLSWERRKRVAIGVAKALRFLHGRRSASRLVGCISPDKVIVDGRDEPHLELSPLDLVGYETKGFVSSPHFGPESLEMKEMREKKDIYGFGLILIQLLTGKCPNDVEALGVEEGIVEWARYCYSDCHIQTWVDPMVLMKQQNEVVEAMNLALRCTAVDPIARPCAKDVLKTLESSTCLLNSCCASNM
ncbi:unnamed protein product [Linum tenue]|uniref:non-specific serine/threonine protein kinase n=1 Tax=Linum tenue TaxID=586396 RepID=A0AAV0JJA1_9ROSI|nr:unnamed protein product [Linum tenue]